MNRPRNPIHRIGLDVRLVIAHGRMSFKYAEPHIL